MTRQSFSAWLNKHFDKILGIGVLSVVIGNVVSMAVTGVDFITLGAIYIMGFVVLGVAAFGVLAAVLLVFAALLR